MQKKLFLLAAAMLLIASCSGNQTQQDQAAQGQEEQGADQIAKLTVAEFNADGEAYEGKLIEVTGTVDHVCKHSGKRLFIMGENPEDRVKIEAGDVGMFDIALEGSEVTIQAVGTVMKMDEAYLDNWASELKGDEPAAGCAEEQKDMGVEAAENTQALDQIADLRQQLADSGRDYLAFCSLEAKSMKEKK